MTSHFTGGRFRQTSAVAVGEGHGVGVMSIGVGDGPAKAREVVPHARPASAATTITMVSLIRPASDARHARATDFATRSGDNSYELSPLASPELRVRPPSVAFQGPPPAWRSRNRRSGP